MHVIEASNVNDAFLQGCHLIRRAGRSSTSRAGNVIEIDRPVTTHYSNPEECVLFDPKRDANPFFHLMEALWMLAGREDVEWISHFLPSIAQFSDDGKTIRGAYGYRWRHTFMNDQLSVCIEMLRRDPTTRRVVLAHWDATGDLDVESKDIPCNTHIYFSMRRGRLDMMVCCRSNDMIWGAYGANAVHFSFLQQYVAGMLNAPLGWYEQVSFNFHVYRDVWEDKVDVLDPGDPYANGAVSPMRLVHYPKDWDADLDTFMKGGSFFNNPFFVRVAVPMRDAFKMWKRGDRHEAYEFLSEFNAQIDWIAAGLSWMERRLS